MANFLYNNARNQFLSGGLGWTGTAGARGSKGQWRVVLLNKGYATYGMYSGTLTGWAATTGTGAGNGISYVHIPNSIIYKNASKATSGAGYTLNCSFDAYDQSNAQNFTSFSTETAFTDWSGTAGAGTSIVDGGVADGSNITFVGIAASSVAASGGNIHAFIIYYEAVNSTSLYSGPFSPLVAFFDQATNMTNAEVSTVAAGDGITPNGGDITIQWDNGANRIFKL